MARLKIQALGALLACNALPAVAQNEDAAADLTLPPTIGEAAQVASQTAAAASAPGDARLEPGDESREDVLEAVVTGGQNDFRLPDLGTSLRREEPRDPDQRIEVTFLNLYDPDNIDPAEEIFPTIEDLRDVGFLRVFKMQFGRRPSEEEE